MAALLVPGVDRSTGDLAWDAIGGEEERAQVEVMSTKMRMMVPMVNDTTRNRAYQVAIERAVEDFKDNNQGKGPHVLDIGMGTGILSLISAKAGASLVTGCEMNPVLARVAAKVSKDNGFEDVIKVHAKRSTDLVVGKDLQSKVDIIVTETLDSNLLTEGIIGSIQHAVEHLANPGVVIIPSSAKVHAMVVDATSFGGLNVSEIGFDGHTIAGMERGMDMAVPLDKEYHVNFHADRKGTVQPLTASFQVFDINFSRDYTLVHKDVEIKPCANTGGKRANAVVVWWELCVYEPRAVERSGGDSKRLKVDNSELLLSTSLDHDESSSQWQDHWFQTLIPLRKVQAPVDEGCSTFRLCFSHTADTIALTEFEQLPRLPAQLIKSGVPSVGYGRLRLAELSDKVRTHSFKQHLAKICAQARAKLPSGKTLALLDMSDGSFCACLTLEDVDLCYSLEKQDDSAFFWKRVVAQGSRSVEFLKALPTRFPDDVGCIILSSELFYETMQSNPVLAAFSYLYQTKVMVSRISGIPVRVAPQCAIVQARVVKFDRLGDAMNPPSDVLGFNHAAAAALWENNSTMNPLYLWCYGHTFLSEAEELSRISFDSQTVEFFDKTIRLTSHESTNLLGLVVWVSSCGHDPLERWYKQCLVGFFPCTGGYKKTFSIANVLKITISCSPEDSNTLGLSCCGI
uniref:Protein arginine N-methyltransferase n=1 Tax=Mucochytrium quahogii TaxID=96639 RepID=A0A7S2R8L3_9STRA